MPVSIRHQLMIIISLLIVITLAAVLTISYWLVSVDYEKKMQQNNSMMAESLASNISQFMQNAYSINGLMAKNHCLINSDQEERQKLVSDIVWQYPYFQVVAVHNLNGDQIVRSSGPLGNRAERWWFKKFMTERQSYISSTYYSLSSGSPITSIIHGIYDDDRRLVGVLMADMEIRKLQQMVDSFSSDDGSYAYLLDDSGIAVAHPDRKQVAELYNYKTMKKKVALRDADGRLLTDEKNNEITQEISFEVAPSLQAIVASVMAGGTGVGEYTDLNGDDYVCAYRIVPIPGSQPWSLIVVQKKSTALAFMRDVTIKTTLVGIIVLALSALLTRWFSRRITNPLTNIVEATNKIKSGDLAVHLTGNSSNEIGILAANFNQMVSELRLHRERLEDLVSDRTAELAVANQEMEAMNEELAAINDTLGETNNRLREENEVRRQTEENLLLRERQYRATTSLLTRPITEMEELMETIMRNAVQLLKADSGYIGLSDEKGKEFYIHYGIGIDESRIMEPQPIGLGMQGHVYKTGKLFYIEDYRNYPHRINDERLDRSTTVIMVPLKQAGKVKGILAVSWLDIIHPVSEDDLEVLSQFGDLAAVAIERASTHAKISQMAYHDALTGLPNRASLNLFLEAEMEKARCGEASGVILLVDIDELKSVNDNFGHSFGDNIIMAVCMNLVRAFGETARVFCVGGDEFVIVLPGQFSREKTVQIADKVIGVLCQEYEVSEDKIHMSASAGVVFYPEDGETAEDILMKADSAMFAAKKAGKNCWRFYELILLQEAYETMMLTNSLRRALERGELSLNYQPQMNPDGEYLVGFEALLRWNSQEHGWVSPARFIPLAEQSGLILPIGQWVLRETCRFAKRLADMGKEHILVSVNISPRQLMADDFVDSVRTCIQAAGVDPGQIQLEITESVLIESIEDSVKKLCRLRSLGVTLALDDFGTGYSSLTYLRNLPVGVLKIDKSFIDKVEDDVIQLHMVGSIIDLGHSLGLSIVAEGVETEEQLRLLRYCGCDCIQGYIYSRPIPEEAAIDFLTSH